MKKTLTLMSLMFAFAVAIGQHGRGFTIYYPDSFKSCEVLEEEIFYNCRDFDDEGSQIIVNTPKGFIYRYMDGSEWNYRIIEEGAIDGIPTFRTLRDDSNDVFTWQFDEPKGVVWRFQFHAGVVIGVIQYKFTSGIGL